MIDKRKFNGGNRNAGRKKGVGIAFDIKKNCEAFIIELLKDDAIKNKAIKDVEDSLFKDKKEDFLYIIENQGLYKIGYTSNFVNRYKNYKSHLGIVNLVYLHKGFDTYLLEDKLHLVFKEKRKTGEWFDLSKKEILHCVKTCSETLI
jgi:hypothetical protein|tara:strand:+ start:1822 stop:2262 length:441 start_codon:yes stop_codon:yes gene_type:complete